MRNRILGLAAGLTTLGLAGCDSPEQVYHAGQDHALYDMSRSALQYSPPAEPAPAPPPLDQERTQEIAPDTPATGAQYIAYTHLYGLSFQPGGAEAAMDTHRERCREAGPAVCQIRSANARTDRNQYFSATLQLRAVPSWIASFRADLQGETEAGGGRITTQTSNATDLTSPILDTEARLTAKRQLRDRLTALLEHENASVEELVQLERELSRVQGDIESSEAQLEAMRARVSMSTLNLNYSTERPPVSNGAFAPVGEALSNSVRNFSSALGDVITFLVFLIPWLVVIIPGGWLALQALRRIFRRRTK